MLNCSVKFNKKNNKVAIVIGSNSDYPVMKECEEILKTKIVSAHRTPLRMYNFASSASKNFSVVIAGAGGAAHLPGMIASLTILPVIGVPMESKTLKGLDSLLSIVQMPKGVPTATVAINGALNAGLLAASIIALHDSKSKYNLEKWKRLQTNLIKKKPK